MIKNRPQLYLLLAIIMVMTVATVQAESTNAEDKDSNKEMSLDSMSFRSYSNVSSRRNKEKRT